VSLYDRARLDSARILNSPQGFTVPVVLTSPTNVEYSLRGFFIDVNLDIDPQTGLPIVGRKAAITVSVYDANGEEQLVDENPADTAGRWLATFTNTVGETVTYSCAEKPMYDRTLGQITLLLKKRIVTEVGD
jgi:hypothetical protein